MRCLLLQIGLPCLSLSAGHFHQQVVVLDWRHDAILWLNCGGTCVCDWVQQVEKIVEKWSFWRLKITYLEWQQKVAPDPCLDYWGWERIDIYIYILILGLIVSLPSSLLPVIQDFWRHDGYIMLFWYITIHYNRIFPYIIILPISPLSSVHSWRPCPSSFIRWSSLQNSPRWATSQFSWQFWLVESSNTAAG